MNEWVSLLLYALMAVFAENLVLTGGIGSSRMLRAARKPKLLLSYGVLICLFSLVTSLISMLLNPWIDGFEQPQLFRPLLYAVVASMVYIAAVLLLKYALPLVYEKLQKILPSASLNCIIMALPLIISEKQLTAAQAVGFSLGGAVGFMLAAWLTSEGIRRINNVKMAKAFLGLPSLFLYLGILSLAFLGFTGGAIFSR